MAKMIITKIKKCYDCMHISIITPSQCKLSSKHILDVLDEIPAFCELDDYKLLEVNDGQE